MSVGGCRVGGSLVTARRLLQHTGTLQFPLWTNIQVALQGGIDSRNVCGNVVVVVIWQGLLQLVLQFGTQGVQILKNLVSQ
jgi:hypothetical protein